MSTNQTLKGFRDFLPAQALKRSWLIDRIKKVFETWGYDPIETPTLEPIELFEGQIGEDEKLFYKFDDPGGRRVALRYDQTVPTCRVVGQYAEQLSMPFRRYQIQPTFRAENPQKGRYREFLQCDADIFGSSSPLADAEVIGLSLDIYRQIGFKDVKVLVNDRSLIQDIPYKAIVAIDKLKKIGEEGVLQELENRGYTKSESSIFLEKVKGLQPNETIAAIFDYLKSQEFPANWYKFEPTLARSFAYSTGPIWEVEIPGFDGGSVLGGERFDNLVEKISGKKIAATGFGLGFDRTLEAAEQFGLIPEIKTKTKVLVTIFSPDLLEKSLELVLRLRQKLIPTELYPDPKVKLDKQLKYASQKGIPYVAILGPEEAEKDLITLKNMQMGEQTKLDSTQLVDQLLPGTSTP